MLNVKQFYKELGHLLYAVAKIDGKIQKKEVKALQDFVSNNLAISERASDSSGMNKAFYVNFEFDSYTDQEVDVESAHNSFITFLKTNVNELPSELIEKSIIAVEQVAGSFRKINKKEREVIDRIKHEIAETADLF